MSFRHRHEWHEGATLPIAVGESQPSRLANCKQCGTLRVAGDRTHYMRRGSGILLEEPPCLRYRHHAGADPSL